jgi:hypothetical protein
MEQTQTKELLARLRRYLDGEISLDELQDTLIPLAWDPDSEGLDSEAKDLVHSIQLYLAEFTSGHLTEEELREHLRELLPRTEAIFISYGGEPNIRSGAGPQSSSVASITIGDPPPVTISLLPSAVGT